MYFGPEDPMSWVRLDDKFWSDPDIEEMGNAAAGAFARMLSYCGDHLTDGMVTAAKAAYIAPPKVVARIAEFGLIEKRGRDWFIPRYLDFNPSREKVLAKRAADKARKGGSSE